MKRDDPTIERIRKTRRLISEKYDHDPKKIVDYYMKLQKKYASRFLEDDTPVEKIPPSSGG